MILIFMNFNSNLYIYIMDMNHLNFDVINEGISIKNNLEKI